MEKINIAELLKDCPKGMKLECTMFDNVTLLRVDNSEGIIYPIIVLREDGNSFTLTKYGQCSNADYAKCVIFPKGKDTWEGFVPPCQFKDGDIVHGDNFCCSYISIYKSNRENNSFYCYAALNSYGKFKFNDYADKSNLRFATEEEKEKLFQAIKDHGYKWNAETKTLEKLIIPKFKVGDKVRGKYTNNIYTISRITSTGYELTNGQSSTFNAEDCYELVPNKFDITTFKPFDKVLVRCSSLEKWRIQFFEKYDKTYQSPFICLGSTKYKQCIPYNDNEHLLDKTDDCDEFYKTW